MLANFLLTSADAVAKALTSRYPVFEVMTMEVAFALIPLGLMVFRPGNRLRWREIQDWRIVCLRGLLAGLGTFFSFYAYSKLPLDEVYAIIFSAPIIVTIASIPLLGERVGPYRAAAVVIGFAGILTMVNPGKMTLSLGQLAAFGGALTTAGAILIMRRGRGERPTVMVAAVMAGLLAVSLPGTILDATPPTASDLALAALAGLLMGTGNFILLSAIRRAPAAVIAPSQYTMLVWAIAYSALLFHDALKPNIIAGAAIVVCSNLYILHRERVSARRSR